MGARRYALRSLVSYRVKHSKRNSISTSNHVLFCLSYKHNSPLSFLFIVLGVHLMNKKISSFLYNRTRKTLSHFELKLRRGLSSY